MVDYVEIGDRRLYVGAKIKTRCGIETLVTGFTLRSRPTEVFIHNLDPRLNSYFWELQTRPDGSIIFGLTSDMIRYDKDIVWWENPKLTQSGKVSLNV